MAGPLKNPKHELFAQELAKGRTQADAYANAGYAPNDANATRLNGNDRVKARVAELQERAAARTELTIASITERLLKIADKGEAHDGALGAPGLSVSRAALMDAAKLNGLVVEKSEVTGKDGGPIQTASTINASALTNEQLRALASIKV